MIAADGRFHDLDDDGVIELRPEDRPSQPVEDVLSAMTEAQLLEIVGLIGATRKFVLTAFDQTSSPTLRRTLRHALGRAQEAGRMLDAVLGSTTRG